MWFVSRLLALTAPLTVTVLGQGTCSRDDASCREALSRSGANSTALKPKAAATLVEQEIVELRDYVRLCEDRVELLKELRDTVNSGHNVALPESHVRALSEKFPLLNEVVLAEDAAPLGSADDYIISKRAIPQATPVSFVKFLPLRSPRTSSSSKSTAQTAMPSALLVAVQEDGTARLFTPSGEMVQAFETGHQEAVTHLSVSPSHDEYFVATADGESVVKVHKVNVRQKRLTREQKQARRASFDEKVSQYFGSQVNVTTQYLNTFEIPADENNKTSRLTALAVVSQQGSKHFVAGDADGNVSIFTRNGTFRAKVTVTLDGSPVETLHAHLSNLLYFSAGSWGFVNLEKLEVTRIDCPVDGRIVAATIDTQQSSRVLAADDRGTVWVLNLKDRRNCKVDHQFPVGATHEPIELASIRGFALGLERTSYHEDPASVVALNMSHVGRKKTDLIAAPSPVVWRRGLQAVRDWTVYKRYQQGDLIAFLSEDGLEIEIVELLMQVYTPPAGGGDFGNFKLPVIAVAIVLVLGYQYVKQKGKFGGRGGGLGGKTDWGKHDFSALRNRRKGLGGFKGGGLGRKKFP